MIRSLALALLLMPAVASAQDMAITHAEAWTMTGNGKISDATIVVHDGRIVSVTASGGVPAGATIIDAGGTFVSITSKIRYKFRATINGCECEYSVTLNLTHNPATGEVTNATVSSP